MGATVRDVCVELGMPFGGVLEGGYALGALGRSVVATMEAFSDVPEAVADPVAGCRIPRSLRPAEPWRDHWPELTDR